MIERTAIISDVHGCRDELLEMLNLLDYKSPYVRIILLGDLEDRGKYSAECIRLARELNIESVKGNHDQKILKWYRSQGTKVDVYDRKDYYSKLSDEDITYIANMPSYIELDKTIIVHAGLKPGIPLAHQKDDDLLYIRYTNSDRKFISLRQINKFGKEALGAIFWTSFGPFLNKDIIYGHHVHSFDEPNIHRYDDGTAAYGLDTGCCFGGNLTAMILEDKTFVQVKAKETYYTSTFDIR
jgi:bis(5'-nucleosyl)-tetraphosphatase (symmetrical)